MVVVMACFRVRPGDTQINTDVLIQHHLPSIVIPSVSMLAVFSLLVAGEANTIVVSQLPVKETGRTLENVMLEFGPLISVHILRWENGLSQQIG